MTRKEVDFHEFITPMDYHYNPDDGLWYDVDTEQLPIPTTTPFIDNNFSIEFYNGNYKFRELNTDQEFESYVQDVLHGEIIGSDFTFLFVNQSGENLDCFFDSLYLMDLDRFIEDVKYDKFTFIYLEAYSDLKFLVWPLPNHKIRFVIQYYYKHQDYYPENYDNYGKCTSYKFLDRILDTEVYKEQFINAFERAIKQAKDALRTLIVNYVKNKNLPEDKIHYLATKMGLKQ